jgi:lipooligosaccharide transport system permease protein
MQAVNYINPLYHSVEVCRALALGQADAGLWIHVSFLTLLAALILPMPLRMMKKRLIN